MLRHVMKWVKHNKVGLQINKSLFLSLALCLQALKKILHAR